jgi:hypothetical protein
VLDLPEMAFRDGKASGLNLNGTGLKNIDMEMMIRAITAA